MHKTALYNEKELLLKIAEGDERAFRQLFLDYYDLIFSTALHYTKVRTYAEDIVQQVFMVLWEKRQHLINIENLEAYFFTMVRNEVFQFLRKKGTEEKYITYLKMRFIVGPTTPELELISKQNRELLEKMIQQLPPKQQQAYRLSREKDLSYEDISLEMKVSLHTVRWHLREALEGLRHILMQYKDDLICLFIIVLLTSIR